MAGKSYAELLRRFKKKSDKMDVFQSFILLST